MQATSKHYVFKTATGAVEFWADRGRVFVVNVAAAEDDSRPLEEQIKSMAPGEFMKRAIAVRMSVDERFPSEVFKARQLLDQAKEVCKIAYHFGDPTNQRVLLERSKQKTRPRILMPREFGLPAIGGPQFRPAHVPDAREALLSGRGVDVVPDLSLPQKPVRLERPAVPQRRRRRA